MSWKWQRVLLPYLAVTIFVCLGLFIPVSQASSDVLAPNQPPTWSQLEAEVDYLEENELFQNEYLDELSKKLDQLKEQSPEDWFSHSSLEATDAIEQAHRTNTFQLQKQMDTANRALNTLQHYSDRLNQEQKQKLQQQFKDALKGMQNGELKPNKELMDRLKEIDPNMLNNIAPERLEQLRKQLRQGAEQLKQFSDGTPGEGNGEGEGSQDDNGDKPGRGGVQRGPGTSPGVLGGEAADLKTGDHERLENKNNKNTRPGDLLETTDSLHDIDKAPTTNSSGGSTNNKGQGGNNVWKNNYLPNEKRALKKYFK